MTSSVGGDEARTSDIAASAFSVCRGVRYAGAEVFHGMTVCKHLFEVAATDVQVWHSF